MKTLLTTTLALAFALFLTNPSTALADRLEVLKATGGSAYSPWLVIAEGEEALIMYHRNTQNATYAYLYYKDSNTPETLIIQGGSSSSGAYFADTITIPGPCEIRNYQGYWTTSTSVSTITLIKIRPTLTASSSSAKYATVIPENSKTDVNVILEQSTDLVNWSTVSPGQFSSSASKRFFRVRSANVPVSITGATNASPIVITSTGHLLNTGDTISISGVVGNTAANGIFTITKVDANSFSLNGSTGNGAYSSGGTWLPNP